jgi:hypothetical protein
VSDDKTTAEPERMDAPNQQAVRPDGSHPADEGSGGSGGSPKKNRGGRPRKPAAAETPAEKPAAAAGDKAD